MSVGKFILICSAGLFLNLLGSLIAKTFNLPIYLDTCGTIFVAALGSYMPGIAVGFLTNLIKAFFDSHQMYFSSVSILIAIFSTFFARKGFFTSLGKALILVPLLTIFVNGSSLVIEKFLYTASFIQSMSALNLTFTTNFNNEFLDKFLSVFVAFLIFRKTPAHIKHSFRLLGQKQAPLTEEMKSFMEEKNYLSSSLRTKLLFILMLSSFLVSSSIAVISYLLFKDAFISERIKTIDGMNAVILNEINPAHIDDYIKFGRDSKSYREIQDKLYAIKNSNSAIKYLYVYRFSEEGCQVVFDLNTATFEGDKPGQIIEYDESALKYKEDLIIGRPIPPIISNDEYGYLLTLYKPLYDVNGKCQCYAAIDFSLDELTDYTRGFIIKLIVLFTGCFVFIFVMGLWFFENNIILPLNTMAYCANTFSYDNETEREKNIELIKSLKIKTGDEIENLYAALIRSSENIKTYLEHLQMAKVEVANMRVKVLAMDELANTDSLTGIKNKTAYTSVTNKLDVKIASGIANFCIAMVDVNFLKRVNDTYGHERGNEYLINSCRLVCSVFGEEHVYRIGGDEFVVVVEGDKVSLCKYFVKQFKAEMERKNSNPLLEPWEKTSAAVGIAFYEPGVDKTAEEVFKRADAEMYKNKLAMKAQRTD